MLLKDHPALIAPLNADDASVRMQTRLARPTELKPLPKAALRSAVNPFNLAAGDQALLNQVVGFYHETLKQSPEALAYLDQRGLHDPTLIERFRLGYANHTLAYRLPPKTLKAGNDMRSALQRIGLLRESGHEHFNDHRRRAGRHRRPGIDDLRPGRPQALHERSGQRLLAIPL